MVCKKDRFNTGNDLCSSKPQDLHDNAMIIDGYVNSDADYVEDRFGIERRTLAGNNKLVDGLVDKVNTAVDDGEGQINKATSDGVASVNSAGASSLDGINTATASGLNQISTSKNDTLIEIDLSKDAAINQIEETGGVEVLQTTGDSTTAVMSQNAVTDALSSIPIVEVVNETGDSTTNVMSQKAVTDAVNNIEDNLGLGYGQQWVDVTDQRVSGAVYTNDTGKPIQTSIQLISTLPDSSFSFYINDNKVISASLQFQIISSIIPAGSTYRYAGGSREAEFWSELR